MTTLKQIKFKFYTARELASMTPLTENSWYHYARTEKVEYEKIGGRIVFDGLNAAHFLKTLKGEDAAEKLYQDMEKSAEVANA